MLSYINKIKLHTITLLPLRLKAIFFSMIFLISILFGYYLDLNSCQEKLIALKKKEIIYQNTLENLKKRIKILDALNQQLNRSQQILYGLASSDHQEETPQHILQIISKISIDTGVQIKLLRPFPVINKKDYSELSLQLQVCGEYHRITTFITRIMNLNQRIVFNDFNLHVINQNPMDLILDIKMKLYTFHESFTPKKQADFFKLSPNPLVIKLLYYFDNLLPIKKFSRFFDTNRILNKTQPIITQNEKQIPHTVENSNTKNIFHSLADPFNKNKIATNQSLYFFKTTNNAFSFNLENAPLRTVLQQIANKASFNLAMSDQIVGNLSLQLNNVTWQQALEIILNTKGLTARQINNIYYIAPTKEIEAQIQQELLAQKQILNLEPLRSELIRIEYGNASDILKLLHGDASPSILSDRGNIRADERTNTLWIQDVESKLLPIKNIIKQLDIPAQQVLIEARIVSIDHSALKELGIRFGTHTTNDGTPLPNNVILAPNITNFKNLSSYLNVDLPVTALGATSLGLALAKLGSSMLLDLELSALQSEGNVQIIASPRLITANQKEAMIQAGEEIPFQHNTNSGSSVEFKKAVLSLKVTPRITEDNRILLTLVVNQDKRGAEVLQGVPAIDTQEITTQVLANNNETIVIGGIYRRDDENHQKRIPFFNNLPGLGNLFKYQKNNQRTRELMIFITPKIVKQSLNQR